MGFFRIRRVLSCTRRAVDDFHMIEEGDRIAVGVSGGKDSLALLASLVELSRFYPVKYELVAITVGMGFEGEDFSEIEKFCSDIGVRFVLKKTEIAPIIFDVRKEKNPCSLCAKMRRGILHDAAIEEGCNKVALGHHYDDAVETFMMNLFNEGRIGAFLPVTYLSRKNITLIRPLIYAPEKDISYFVSHNELPIHTSLCPEDGHTERENIKNLLNQLERDNKGLKYRIFGAMKKDGVFEQTEER